MTVVEENLRPNLAILIGGCAAVILVSAMVLPWPIAAASTVLGALMIAGADIDARTFFLPDFVTWGAVAGGVLAAAVLDPIDPWLALTGALARAAATAGILAAMRWGYGRWRGREGLGFGDVKLAAAVGAWLPLYAIPFCFGLAASGALLAVLLARVRGQAIDATVKIPFGAFLCPTLWLLFYATVLPG